MPKTVLHHITSKLILKNEYELEKKMTLIYHFMSSNAKKNGSLYKKAILKDWSSEYKEATQNLSLFTLQKVSPGKRGSVCMCVQLCVRVFVDMQTSFRD